MQRTAHVSGNSQIIAQKTATGDKPLTVSVTTDMDVTLILQIDSDGEVWFGWTQAGIHDDDSLTIKRLGTIEAGSNEHVAAFVEDDNPSLCLPGDAGPRLHLVR
jgi:ligand-binding sensor domain-containing protein